MRQLWIARINAAARLYDLSYSKFMHGLQKAGILIDRKILSDLAVYNEETFAELVTQAKAALNEVAMEAAIAACQSEIQALSDSQKLNRHEVDQLKSKYLGKKVS